MRYHSTRNEALTADSMQAVLQGLAPDGGLYVALPPAFDWQGVLPLSTFGMAERILSALLPEFGGMHELVHRAYAGKFETDELTPLVPVGERYVLELFRGPTSAFKDVALSMLPQLITAARERTGMADEILILTATSGDTGKAALAGFRDVPGTKIIVFYPDAGVSQVQEAQMVTQEGENVCVCAVRGNFDDTQTGVKEIFAAGIPADCGAVLSSANSINIGRLADGGIDIDTVVGGMVFIASPTTPLAIVNVEGVSMDYVTETTGGSVFDPYSLSTVKVVKITETYGSIAIGLG